MAFVEGGQVGPVAAPAFDGISTLLQFKVRLNGPNAVVLNLRY
jgi:hypothetical protein